MSIEHRLYLEDRLSELESILEAYADACKVGAYSEMSECVDDAFASLTYLITEVRQLLDIEQDPTDPLRSYRVRPKP